MNLLPAAHAADKLENYLNEKINQIHHPFGIDLQRVVGVFLEGTRLHQPFCK